MNISLNKGIKFWQPSLLLVPLQRFYADSCRWLLRGEIDYDYSRDSDYR